MRALAELSCSIRGSASAVSLAFDGNEAGLRRHFKLIDKGDESEENAVQPDGGLLIDPAINNAVAAGADDESLLVTPYARCPSIVVCTFL